MTRGQFRTALLGSWLHRRIVMLGRSAFALRASIPAPDNDNEYGGSAA